VPTQPIDLSCFSDRHFWHGDYDKAWSHKSVLLEAFDPRFDPWAFALACIVGIGMAHFLFWFRTKAKVTA
jgi:hypothetical protein